MKRFLRAGAQALEHARRQGGGDSQIELNPGDIRAIRLGLHLSQKQFAETYGFNLNNVNSWEIGRRKPDQASTLLLQLIQIDPQAMRQLVNCAKNKSRKERLEPA